VPSIKGLVIREFLRWYEESRGRESTMRAYGSLPEELRAQLDPERDCFGMLAGSWYPIAIVTGMLESITWGLGPEERSTVLREGVRHSVGVTLTGVYRVLFRTLMTPERHARYAQKIWDNYYDSGTVTGRMLSETRAEQCVSDWPGHHPILCELSIWSLTVFHEHMGCKNVKVSRSSCVVDGQHSRRRPSSQGMRAASRVITDAPPPPSSSARSLDAEPPSPPSDRPSEGCRFLIQWSER
jgi:hypothetical protein